MLCRSDSQSLPSQEFTRRPKWRREWDSTLPRPIASITYRLYIATNAKFTTLAAYPCTLAILDMQNC
jgi:hypothetical protein